MLVYQRVKGESWPPTIRDQKFTLFESPVFYFLVLFHWLCQSVNLGVSWSLSLNALCQDSQSTNRKQNDFVRWLMFLVNWLTILLLLLLICVPNGATCFFVISFFKWPESLYIFTILDLQFGQCILRFLCLHVTLKINDEIQWIDRLCRLIIFCCRSQMLHVWNICRHLP